MVQRRRGTRFLLEAAQAVGIGGERLGQDLDGNFAVQPRVVRAIHFAHAACAKRRTNFVLPENRSGSQSHER